MISSTSNPFSEQYKTITDFELISILENEEDYQEAAVEAARQELEGRQLSQTELETVKSYLTENKFEKEAAKQKRELVEKTIKEKFSGALESLNPIHEELPAIEKTLRFIVIFWALLTTYQMIHDYRIEFQSLKAFPFHPFVNSLTLFPYFMLPVSIYHLWKRRSLGWTLFVIYLTFVLLTELWSFYFAITWKPSGIQWMDDAFKPSIPKIVLRLLFVAGTFYAMCRQNMRVLFAVEKKKMFAVAGITAVVWFCAYWV